MTVTIAHLSDLHWERRDDNTRDRLVRALKLEKPSFLAFTGDLADNPWGLEKAKPWLLDICKDCDLDAQTRLLVIPGNHDYRAYGNLGFRPFTARPFRRSFGNWMKRRIVHLPDLGVTFFLVDSNPIMFGFARGKVGRRQLRSLRNTMRKMAPREREQIQESVKIALVHHHPLPIPYEGQDPFLLLEDAHDFMQFLAENRIEVVLHGHKHRAPYSFLALGTCGGSDRILEVLGAGAGVIETPDHDPRGHNFNLICIEPSGLRYVRQFFAHPGEDFREDPNPVFPSHSFDLAYQRSLVIQKRRADKAGHLYNSIHWDLGIDIEGDRFNEMTYTGLRVVAGAELPRITPPSYLLDTGHLSGVWLNPKKTSTGVSLHILNQEPRRLEFEVLFADSPTQEDPASFAIQSYDLNACSLDISEFKKKFPKRQIQREWEEKSIIVPVDQFSWSLRFPEDLKFDQGRLPHFAVFDEDDPEKEHEWLTSVLQQNFHYSEALNTAFLRIRKPPVGYRYRIYWYVPSGPVPLEKTPASERLLIKQFSRSMLDLARQARDGNSIPPKLSEVNRVLEAFGHLVAGKIEAMLQKTNLVNVSDFDISLMVYDDSQPIPLLRVVACFGSFTESFWSFSLEVGDGNAGRCYKKNILRCFDREIDDPKHNPYVKLPGRTQHSVLYSLPLRNPAYQDLIYAVLNLGSFADMPASLLRLLGDEAGVQWLLEQSQRYLLPRLREVV
jgi:predicted MPP superfamily phosphohydrolase